jgi:deoxycytidine triphosphate deaminase
MSQTAKVLDKSSYAHVFVTAFNTFIDCGFCGNMTLELTRPAAQPQPASLGAQQLAQRLIMN